MRNKALPAPTEVLIFDCQESESLPGKLVSNPGLSTDSVAKEVYSDTSLLVDFFRKCFGRNSIDDAGMGIVSSVHYSRSYVNAFWTGAQMVYGDGDGLIFKNMTSADDFIGHELQHGVTQHTAALIYEGEPGALNESMSDVFGSMFRQWKRSWDIGAADWIIGSELMGPTAIQMGWVCLRNLLDPSANSSLTKQPKHYKDYVQGGGPHDNSGIPNHAFYRACSAVGGYSWETVGLVWYAAIRSRHIKPNMKFKDFAALTCHEAKRIFPKNPSIATAVKEAWAAVGLR
ncbi:MAG: M4 family metallopeptidase [Rhizobiaceae bacterium]|nr:M4 family metallopeptidase [Rhizobiaceae bacterium]